MLTISDFQKLISEYLKNKDLDSFSAKFAELFYNIEETGDSFAIELSYSIESMLSAVTAGLDAEPKFVEAIRALVPSNSVAQLSNTLSWGSWESIKQSVAVCPAETVHADIKLSVGFGLAATPQDVSQSNTALIQSQPLQVA